MQSGFWRADWFLGVVVVAAFVLFSSMSELVPSLERKAYDAALLTASRTPSDKVAIIAIDKQSIDNIGRWPWPRDLHARMIDRLAQAKARAVGYLVFFAGQTLNVPTLFVGVAAFAVLGILGFELVRRFEAHVTPWKKEAQGQ